MAFAPVLPDFPFLRCVVNLKEKVTHYYPFIVLCSLELESCAPRALRGCRSPRIRAKCTQAQRWCTKPFMVSLFSRAFRAHRGQRVLRRSSILGAHHSLSDHHRYLVPLNTMIGVAQRHFRTVSLLITAAVRLVARPSSPPHGGAAICVNS